MEPSAASLTGKYSRTKPVLHWMDSRLAGQTRNTISVSYTHLDVYKRQIRFSAGISAVARVKLILSQEIETTWFLSDVYKRQDIGFIMREVFDGI